MTNELTAKQYLNALADGKTLEKGTWHRFLDGDAIISIHQGGVVNPPTSGGLDGWRIHHPEGTSQWAESLPEGTKIRHKSWPTNVCRWFSNGYWRSSEHDSAPLKPTSTTHPNGWTLYTDPKRAVGDYLCDGGFFVSDVRMKWDGEFFQHKSSDIRYREEHFTNIRPLTVGDPET